ncbi:hypothetical protein Tco_0350280, partial [Tanacetum coccineum]
HDQCPKNITVTPIVEKSNDGFQTVVNRRKNGKTGFNNNSTNRNGVKIGGQSVKPTLKYVPKASVSVLQTRASNVVATSKTSSCNAPTISKIQPSKASDLPSSANGSFKVKNGGTKVTPPYGSSSIPISNSYALLEEDCC